jgi:hypothetical protein
VELEQEVHRKKLHEVEGGEMHGPVQAAAKAMKYVLL